MQRRYAIGLLFILIFISGACGAGTEPSAIPRYPELFRISFEQCDVRPSPSPGGFPIVDCDKKKRTTVTINTINPHKPTIATMNFRHTSSVIMRFEYRECLDREAEYVAANVENNKFHGCPIGGRDDLDPMIEERRESDPFGFGTGPGRVIIYACGPRQEMEIGADICRLSARGDSIPAVTILEYLRDRMSSWTEVWRHATQGFTGVRSASSLRADGEIFYFLRDSDEKTSNFTWNPYE